MKTHMKVAIVTTTISFAMLSGCVNGSKTKININDYITVECSGYSTVATPDASLSIKDMITANPEAFGLDKNASASEIRAVGTDVYDIIEQHDGCMTLDKTEKIVNGDVITITWNQEALAAVEEKYAVKWNAENYTFTVDNLTELTPYNPFDYFDISFKLDQYGADRTKYELDGRWEDDPVSGILFKVNDGNYQITDRFNLGDTVKFTFYVDFPGKTIEEYCAERGYLIEQTEKEFVVNE